MTKIRKSQKVLFAMLAVFLLVGLFCTLLHHHADGQEKEDCQICRLAQQVIGFFVFALTALISLVVSSRKFFVVPPTRFNSLFLSSNLKDRAPPLFA